MATQKGTLQESGVLETQGMTWEVGQRVECKGMDWGTCQVTLSSDRLVVIYCPRYELVTTANQLQLEQAGWEAVQQSNVVWLKDWQKQEGRISKSAKRSRSSKRP